MKTLIAAAITIWLAAGCMSSYQVDRSEAEVWVPEVRKLFLEEEVTVTFEDNSSVEGKVTFLSSDSIRIHLTNIAWQHTYPLHSVRSITVAPSAGAPVLGAVLGTAVGAAIGAGLGAAAGGAPKGWSSATSVFGVIGGGLGMLIGGVAGGEAGRGYHYEIVATKKE